MNTHDLVGKIVWYWQFHYALNGRQILATSDAGKDSVVRHSQHHQIVDIGGLSIPDDLPCQVEEDQVRITLGEAYVVLDLRN